MIGRLNYDALNVEIRDGQVERRPVYAAIGVDLAGYRKEQ